MSSKHTPWRPGALFVAALLVCVQVAASGAILDPDANHPILRAIAADLDGAGIDVVQDWRSRVATGSRPVVAPLDGYAVASPTASDRWISEFNLGAVGAVTAIRSREALSHDEFVRRWNNTPKEKRVFVSFAREDLAQARIVKQALESQGFVGFIYLKGATEAPVTTPLVVGQLLRSAGVHVVVDTPTARTKSGVITEALAVAKYRRPDVAPPPPPPPPPAEGHVVDIYGARERCPRTRQAIEIFQEVGAKIRYHDVDADFSAAAVVARNRKYLEGGDLLPFIRVDGRPIQATGDAIGSELRTWTRPRRSPGASPKTRKPAGGGDCAAILAP